jgi:Eco57I restriction-modification methylase
MSFDRTTRNALARIVGQVRELLKVDVMDQLRRLGFQADGCVLDLDQIAGLSELELMAGRELRELLEHFVALESGSEAVRRQAAYDRLAREIGFTTLNRLVALRMAEERGLIVQAVGRGLASDGFQIYERVARDALGNRAETYRAYLECLYDELALDLPMLFDRTTPESRIFPSERCLQEVLTLLNDVSLAHLWKEDEAIGWVYQYYNDPDERKKMREAQAPRNSRELAVRNQFFTPRYVVEFLTDNTLGRLWYEIQQGNTKLSDQCCYLVRRPVEIFLQDGEEAPQSAEPEEDLRPEELLNRPVFIPFRVKKDPRDLKILDPACGSGHFLLYAFDLLETLYEEAWADSDSPISAVIGTRLRNDYMDIDALHHAVPGLILRHNLYGIDIDPRACQIAALALWLRAQRSYQQLRLQAVERPQITKSNIVCAEPMPGEREMLEEYLKEYVDPRLQPLVRTIWGKMRLAGEAGSLLKIEEEIETALAEAREQALVDIPPVRLSLLQRDQPVQIRLTIPASDESTFWEQAEEKLLAALHDYANKTHNGSLIQKRLFAEDVVQGFAFIDLCRNRFDIVLMNPPFGESSKLSKPYIEYTYSRTKNDIYAAFVERGLSILVPGGMLGAITSRTGFFLSSFRRWREEILLKEARPTVFADLGYGILDTAMVETAAYCLEAKR